MIFQRINNWLNNSKHVEHFDETIYEEYDSEKIDAITVKEGSTYRDNTKLDNKTNYFDPLSLAKSPLSKKASTSNRFQLMPNKKVEITEPPTATTSLNSKTKLKPVVASPPINNKMSKSLKNSTDEPFTTKFNARSRNARVPIKSFESNEKDKKLLTMFDLDEKNVDDIMIVDSVKSQDTL